ncbi:uncharacterized protein LOC124440270 [Xenia sp. Carnegie-2017]|uniref:uncharacterized protein LOC124440270 n=1 Tax=Xenia sp. Carnegie-2017 TaxID=2897299 RepID=UPI001F04B38B|nr:uncharacterized protein LOC124440270 [Xenia sp. Carnegie-2017]
MLALVFYTQQFRHYLYGLRFIARTDHDALRWLTNFKEPNGQVARWLEKLAEFDFKVQSRPGKRHGNADSLSRRPNPSIEVHNVGNMELEIRTNSEKAWCPTWTSAELRSLQLAEPTICYVLSKKEIHVDPLRKEELKGLSRAVHNLCSHWDVLEIRDGVLYRHYENDDGTTTEPLLVVPRCLVNDVLRSLHDSPTSGHLGITKTLSKVRQRFYWPGQRQDVEEGLMKCKKCAVGKGATKENRAPLVICPPGYPLERIAIDILGPLPVSTNGNKYIMVVGDYLSKWTESYAIPNQEAYTVAEKLVNEFICRFGAPDTIHTDQGWDDESRHEMKMVPLVFKSKKGNAYGYKAEQKLYSFIQTISVRGFGFHGLKFDDEEVDFLLVFTGGVAIIECKRIMKNKIPQAVYDDAFGQLIRQETAISCYLDVSKDINIIKVVCLPMQSRCDITEEGARVFFEEDFLHNEFKEWLYNFPSMDFDLYKAIVMKFLCKYHCNGGNKFNNEKEFKRRAIDDTSDCLDRISQKYFKTDEQASVLRCIDRPGRFWVKGAAGTGKTFVLKMIAKEFFEKHKSDKRTMLIITFNVAINNDINSWITENVVSDQKKIRVQTFRRLLRHMLHAFSDDVRLQNENKEDRDIVEFILRNKGVDKYFCPKFVSRKYTFLLVDEAQDLSGEWIKLLEDLLIKNKGAMYVFEDPFQNVRGTESPQSGHFNHYSLHKVLRNTHNTFKAYKGCYEQLATETGHLPLPTIDHAVFGLEPWYKSENTKEKLQARLLSTVEELRGKGIRYDDIAIISSSWGKVDLVEFLTNKIPYCDAEESTKKKNEKINSVIVDSYQKFKGLEAKVLIFYIPVGWTPRYEDIYVSLSRAFCHPIVLGGGMEIDRIKDLGRNDLQ